MLLTADRSFIIVVVVVVTSVIIGPLLVDADILRFGGPDPNSIDYGPRTTIGQQDSVQLSSYLVFLPATVNVSSPGGTLFAFEAYTIAVSQQFDFQIYRLSSTTSTYSKIFSLTVRTSTVNQTEVFYLASYLGHQPCIYVQPGDVLALNFYNWMIPVFFGWRPLQQDKPNRVAFVTDLRSSSIQYFEAYIFAASAFYDTNGTPPSSNSTVEVDCNTADRIPVQFLPTTTTPAPTTPYVPIIGATGATGPQGPKGIVGAIGDNGTDGSLGIKGETGFSPPGSSGAIGYPGENGTDNYAVGATGYTGSNGSIGDMGETGEMGVTGSPGPIGLMGKNLTYLIKGPYADTAELTWWLQQYSIQGCYIWLAIISFVFVVAVVVTIVTICRYAESGRTLKR